jgi:Spy/CpxP family protein refolding chaperone
MKSRLIFFTCFFITFGAGTAVGMLWATPAPKPSRDPFLSELDLTQEQRDKIKGFWTEAMKNGWQREQRDAVFKEREAAMKAMLTDEQKAKQEEIQKVFQSKMDEMNAASKRSRDEAYEKTKAILNPDQLVKYEEMRKKRFEGREGRDGREGRGPGGPPHGGPTFGGFGPGPGGDGKSKDRKSGDF